jgi:hypothetical protein
MENISVTLEIETHFLKKIKNIAHMERRTFPDQTARCLEKGICILEIQQNMRKPGAGPSASGKIP